MKVAITAQEADTQSKIDRHFGRCAFFYILDEITGKSEFMENPGKSSPGCRAEIIVGKLVKANIKKIISGDFGTNVQQLLNKYRIQMILQPDEDIRIDRIAEILTTHQLNMPNLDHTGPEGKGPRTGRGLGRCGKPSDQIPPAPHFELGKGMAARRQSGGGSGQGHRFRAGNKKK